MQCSSKPLYLNSAIRCLFANCPRLTYPTRCYTRQYVDSPFVCGQPNQLDNEPAVGIACRYHRPNYGDCHYSTRRTTCNQSIQTETAPRPWHTRFFHACANFLGRIAVAVAGAITHTSSSPATKVANDAKSILLCFCHVQISINPFAIKEDS